MTRVDRERRDQREQRVRAIRDQIDRGVYRVPAESVADAVIAWYRRVDPITRR